MTPRTRTATKKTALRIGFAGGIVGGIVYLFARKRQPQRPTALPSSFIDHPAPFSPPTPVERVTRAAVTKGVSR